MRIWSAVAVVLGVWVLGLGCGPKRLKDVSQKEDLRTEGQLRAERIVKQAEKLFDAGELLGAAREYLAALREAPGAYRAHQGLGDIYELQGDPLAALMEHVAHTELAPNSKLYMERMLSYVFAKFARSPGFPRDIGKERQAAGVLALSEAVVAFRQANYDLALSKVSEAAAGLKGSGLPEYFEGQVALRKGDLPGALGAFERSVGENGYFARRLLADREEARLPELLPRLRTVLQRELRAHPADTESGVLLSAICLRLNDPAAALKATRDALAWTNPRWDVLLLKAVAHDRLGERVSTDQTLSEMRRMNLDPSLSFPPGEPSLFHGLLADSASDFAATRLAASIDEPARSYFLWRLKEERGDPAAQAAREAFFGVLAAAFPAGEFESPPASGEPERQPAGLAEFMGMAQGRIEAAMEGFWRCDASRRQERANPSGRLVLRVELARDGKIAKVGVEENTTLDPYLAYCIVRKLLAISFPKLLRASEAFKVPVFVGPEVDGLGQSPGSAAPKP